MLLQKLLLQGNNSRPLQRNQRLTAATQVVFKNCAPFGNCTTKIDGTFLDKGNFINITILEHSKNYFDISRSLWAFKRDEVTNNANVINDNNALSFKYKTNFIANTEANGTKRE